MKPHWTEEDWVITGLTAFWCSFAATALLLALAVAFL